MVVMVALEPVVLLFMETILAVDHTEEMVLGIAGLVHMVKEELLVNLMKVQLQVVQEDHHMLIQVVAEEYTIMMDIGEVDLVASVEAAKADMADQLKVVHISKEQMEQQILAEVKVLLQTIVGFLDVEALA